MADTIGFRSLGNWTAEDLESFSRAVASIHDSLVVARVKQRAFESLVEHQDYFLQRLEKFADSPFLYEYFEYLRRALRDSRKGRGYPIPLLPLFGGQSFMGEQSPFGAALPLPSDEEVFKDIRLYRKPSEVLKVDRIIIESPGGFSFTGIGEIIQQFRELIKDLWFRNRYERDMARLDLIDRYLSIQRENSDINIPVPPSVRKQVYLPKKVEQEVLVLQDLERRGLLENVPENLDYVPGEDTA